jgi:fucose 4-O-acetylase-like acetyltransferase
VKAKKRLYFLDIARGLGIIAVVMGHSLSPLKSFLYLFHVPLFFFISGYLYNTNNSILQTLKKRIKSLYVPVLKYGVIFILMHNVFYYLKFYNKDIGGYYHTSDYFHQLVKLIFFTVNSTEPLLAGLWFLKSLFIIELLFSLVDKISNLSFFKKYINLVKVLLVLFGTVLGWSIIYLIKYPLSLNTPIIIPLISMIFYFTGYFAKYNAFEFKFNIWYWLITCSLLAVASFYLTIDLKEIELPNAFLYYTIALLGIYLVLSLSVWIQNYSFKQIFIYVGENTLPILALHFLFFKVASFIIIQFFSLPINSLVLLSGINIRFAWILYVVMGVSLPLIWLKLRGQCSIFFKSLIASLNNNETQ